jgi:hypothetical protein
MKFHKHHSKEQAEIERLTAELNLYKKVFEHIYEKPITHLYASIKNSEEHIYASIKKSICADILPTCQAPPLPPPRHIPPRMVSRPLKITSEV